MGLVAYHGGGWQPNDSFATAWSRALGYPRAKGLQHDLERNTSDVSRRDGEARRALFAAHGVDLDTSSWEETAGAIARLIEQTPEDIRVHFGIQEALQALEAEAL